MCNRRVLVLNHFAAPKGEAGGTRHVELFKRLQGWEHLIIASNLNPLTGRKIDDSEGFVTVPVIGYSSNGISRILNWMSYAVTAFIKGLRAGPVDLVYGSSPHLLAALSAWFIATLRRVPFVLEVRDIWPKVLLDMNRLSASSPIYRVLITLEKFLYSRAARIVILADGSRIHLEKYGVPAEKIKYIPNGADPDDFKTITPRSELRQRYQFYRRTAVYTGAHGPANGLNLLLEAAELVPDIDIVLIGGGIDKDALVQNAAQRELKNVRFLPPIPKSEIPELLKAADLGIHTLAEVQMFSDSVSPNKIYDYMAASLPIASNSPGLVHGLIHGASCGWGTQPRELHIALQQFMVTPEDELHTLGAQGCAWIQKHQSRSAMSGLLRELLEDVLADDK